MTGQYRRAKKLPTPRMHDVCRVQRIFNNTKTTHYSRTNDFNARETGAITTTGHMSRGERSSTSQTPIAQPFLREFWALHLHPARALQKEGAQISTAGMKNQRIPSPVILIMHLCRRLNYRSDNSLFKRERQQQHIFLYTHSSTHLSVDRPYT